ncbi:MULTISPECIES: hypothetical protein [unclassified Methanosarcina]|uniref:hypothetical protein n=1 Tax=unclassified Methanosarcina TaxID=2644672 RepID=UPI000AB8E097|nr:MULTISPECIES: hypothetical protein [unclassified Methanosarcina]
MLLIMLPCCRDSIRTEGKFSAIQFMEMGVRALKLRTDLRNTLENINKIVPRDGGK